ncbi:MAG TPA: hypothetical protein VFN35_19980, partial [Ktedonobacteraceae bacterium]|nr:hypothetical protein [Ktedonobacteraceae bacterium]
MFAPHWFRRFRLLFLIALSLASLIVFLPVAVPRAAAQSATSEPYNLVTNGDFTTGLSSWNWSAGMPIAGTETACTCGAGGPISHLPQAYAHPTGSGGLIYAWQNIPNVQAGQYILIGWINTSGGTQTAVIQADDGTGAAYCVTAQTHTTIWKQFFCSFNLPSPKTIHVALLADNSGPTAGGWVNWDDISLSVSSASGYDLLPYIGRTSGNGNAYVFASSEVDIVTASTNVMGVNPGFYQLKVPSVSAPGTNTWEELSYDSSYIYRVRDTSPTATEWYEDLSSCPSACTPGSKWVPRTMTAGQSFFHSDNTIKFYFKTSCTPSRLAYQESNGIRMMGAYQHFTIFDAGNNLTSITL